MPNGIIRILDHRVNRILSTFISEQLVMAEQVMSRMPGMMYVCRLSVVVVGIVVSRLRNWNLAIAVSASIYPAAGHIGRYRRCIARVMLGRSRRVMMTVVKVQMMAKAVLNVSLLNPSMLPITRMLRARLLRSNSQPKTHYRQTQYVFH